MGKQQLFLFMMLFQLGDCYGQVLKKEAIYSNAEDLPYKIERKYFDRRDTSCLFVAFTKDDNASVKKKESKRRDTVVLQESYCRIFTGHNEEENKVFGQDKITQLLKKNIRIEPDSLVILETVTSYFTGRQLHRIEIKDANGFIYCTKLCSKIKSGLLVKDYRADSLGVHLFMTDSIVWNHDSTELRWIRKTAEGRPDNPVTGYRFLASGRQNFIDDTLSGETRFLSGGMRPDRLIINYLIYTDTYYSFELRQLESEQPTFIFFRNGQQTVINYHLDRKRRIKALQKFINGTLVKQVAYRYR